MKGGWFTAMARVLVVDDEAGIRQIVRMALTRINVDVIEAKSAEEAFTLVLKCQPDIVLTDIRLPLLDGLELARRLKNLNACLPIVFISAGDDLNTTVTSAEVPHHYLQKPFKIQHLQHLVWTLLQELPHPS